MALAEQQFWEPELFEHPRDGENMPVGKRGLWDGHGVGHAATLERRLEGLDFLGGQMAQVGQGTGMDLAAFTPTLAQQNRGWGVPIGDLDYEHATNINRPNMASIRKNHANYMPTFYKFDHPQTRITIGSGLNSCMNLGQERIDQKVGILLGEVKVLVASDT